MVSSLGTSFFVLENVSSSSNKGATWSSLLIMAVSGALLVVFAFCLGAAYAQVNLVQGQRCKTPATAPEKIEKIISTCQDEIKIAILQEALDVLGETAKDVSKAATSSRSKRDTFTREERRIAGCLLQCVYRKVKALDETGFANVDGLIKLYAEGVTERGYFLAIAQAVQQCTKLGHQQRLASNESDRGAQICDFAYNVFDCVSDQMGSYCAGN